MSIILTQIQIRVAENETKRSEAQSSSSNLKRSALSESLEVYKNNCVKGSQIKETREDRNAGRYCHKNMIKSDYKLVCRPEKKVPKKEKCVNCCFHF